MIQSLFCVKLKTEDKYDLLLYKYDLLRYDNLSFAAKSIIAVGILRVPQRARGAFA